MAGDKHTRRDFLKAMGVGLGAVALPGYATLAQGASGKKGKAKPNIILFLTDDQGWTDTSVQMMAGRADSKSDFYQTPNLEKLAKEGMIFSSAYSPAPVCTPTRTSIQFGKTPARLRQTVVNDVIGSDCKDEISIAEMVKSANPNYVTAHFGKWDVASIRRPKDVGYDISDGPMGNFHGDWRALDDRRPLPEDNPKRIFSLTKRANNFMQEQVKAGRPFYMQVSHYAVHVHHDALRETIEKYLSARRMADKNLLAGKPPGWIVYAAMIENLDTGLGMLLNKVDELGIKDNTYVIFTSDNGGGSGRGNKPLKGSKANLWEGGIRVPTVVRGPAVRAGCYCDVPVAGWDFLPTIADLIGNKKPLPDGIDGGSLRPLFEKANKGKIKRGTEPLIFHYPWYDRVPMSAIRLGDYKLIKNLNTDEIRLFNLSEDIGENNDLSGSMPQKTKQLHKKLMDYLKAVNAETIEAMRQGRSKQLHKSMTQTNKQIQQLQESIKKATSKLEKEKIGKKLKEQQRFMEINKNGMERLERGPHRSGLW